MGGWWSVEAGGEVLCQLVECYGLWWGVLSCGEVWWKVVNVYDEWWLSIVSGNEIRWWFSVLV